MDDPAGPPMNHGQIEVAPAPDFGRPSRRSALTTTGESLPSLLVMAPGAVVRCEGMTLKIEREGGAALTCPVQRIRALVTGPTSRISSEALALLAEHGRAFVHMGFGGAIRCWLQPAAGDAAAQLLLQAAAERDRAAEGGATRTIVAEIIRSKIDGMDAIMQQHQRALAGRDDPAAGEIERSRSLMGTWQSHLDTCRNIDAVRGVEGAATAGYFRSMRLMLTGELRTERRSRRPPLDPVNAMLSFGYALLLGELVGAAAAHGLNPCMGLLHVPSDRGRPSLALDLMEPLRISIVDRLVIAMCNRRQVNGSHFDAGGDGVLMNADGRRAFLEAYQECMASGVRVGDGPEMAVRSLVDQAVHWYAEQLQTNFAAESGRRAE